MKPFIDLKAQLAAHEQAIRSRMDKVLAHGRFILGPEVEELEARLAAYTGARHCVGCASGTEALSLILMAEGIGPGDAVITTSFTFIATAEAVALQGARPVFVDIDPHTWNISPRALEDCLDHWNPAWGTPRAIIGVDLFGLPAPFPELKEIARARDLLLIEDAAQGFGGSLDGERACSLGDYAATSFFPAKPLGCYGDGGAIFCGEAGQAEALQSLRFHGRGEDKNDNRRVGLNSRLDTLQAAVLLAKMDFFDDELEARGQVADAYTRVLSGVDPQLVLPHVPEGYGSAWAQYSLLLPPSVSRADVQERLKGQGIPTMVYYPTPLHKQSVFAGLDNVPGGCPVSGEVCGRILSLPMHPYLTRSEARDIAHQLAAALH